MEFFLSTTGNDNFVFEQTLLFMHEDKISFEANSQVIPELKPNYTQLK